MPLNYPNISRSVCEELFGQSEITIPTLTRPWIVPGEILIRQTKDNAYIYKATLKVMLEQDYLKDAPEYKFDDPRLKTLNEYSSELIRQEILPKLTREVNSSKNYAGLRQVYYSLILAQWFKQSHIASGAQITSKIDSFDLDGLTSKKSWSKATYFKAYQKSFSNGEYKLQETVNRLSGTSIRQYFSGGEELVIPRLGPNNIVNPAVIGDLANQNSLPESLEKPLIEVQKNKIIDHSAQQLEESDVTQNTKEDGGSAVAGNGSMFGKMLPGFLLTGAGLGLGMVSGAAFFGLLSLPFIYVFGAGLVSFSFIASGALFIKEGYNVARERARVSNAQEAEDGKKAKVSNLKGIAALLATGISGWFFEYARKQNGVGQSFKDKLNFLAANLFAPPSVSSADEGGSDTAGEYYWDELEKVVKGAIASRKEYDEFMTHLNKEISKAGISGILSWLFHPIYNVRLDRVYNKLGALGTRNTLSFREDSVSQLEPGFVRLNNGFAAPENLVREVWNKLEIGDKHNRFMANALSMSARFPGIFKLTAQEEAFWKKEGILQENGSLDFVIRNIVLSSFNGDGAFELRVLDPKASDKKDGGSGQVQARENAGISDPQAASIIVFLASLLGGPVAMLSTKLFLKDVELMSNVGAAAILAIVASGIVYHYLANSSKQKAVVNAEGSSRDGGSEELGLGDPAEHKRILSDIVVKYKDSVPYKLPDKEINAVAWAIFQRTTEIHALIEQLDLSRFSLANMDRLNARMGFVATRNIFYPPDRVEAIVGQNTAKGDGGEQVDPEVVKAMVEKNIALFETRPGWMKSYLLMKSDPGNLLWGYALPSGEISIVSSVPILDVNYKQMKFMVGNGYVTTIGDRSDVILENGALIKKVLEDTFKELDKKPGQNSTSRENRINIIAQGMELVKVVKDLAVEHYSLKDQIVAGAPERGPIIDGDPAGLKEKMEIQKKVLSAKAVDLRKIAEAYNVPTLKYEELADNDVVISYNAKESYWYLVISATEARVQHEYEELKDAFIERRFFSVNKLQEVLELASTTENSKSSDGGEVLSPGTGINALQEYMSSPQWRESMIPKARFVRYFSRGTSVVQGVAFIAAVAGAITGNWFVAVIGGAVVIGGILGWVNLASWGDHELQFYFGHYLRPIQKLASQFGINFAKLNNKQKTTIVDWYLREYKNAVESGYYLTEHGKSVQKIMEDDFNAQRISIGWNPPDFRRSSEINSPLQDISGKVSDRINGIPIVAERQGILNALQSPEGKEFYTVISDFASDTDSVASAIAEAYMQLDLYGYRVVVFPLIQGELNDETKYVLKIAGINLDNLIFLQKEKGVENALAGLKQKNAKLRITLVDHSKIKAEGENLRELQNKVYRVIDHHPINGGVNPREAVFQTIGATATLIYERFVDSGVKILPPIALLLLSAILSDTKNLNVNVTQRDRQAVEGLKEITGYSTEDAEALFKKQTHALNSIRGDEPLGKVFNDDNLRYFTGKGAEKYSFTTFRLNSDEPDLFDSRFFAYIQEDMRSKGLTVAFFNLSYLNQQGGLSDKPEELYVLGEPGKVTEYMDATGIPYQGRLKEFASLSGGKVYVLEHQGEAPRKKVTAKITEYFSKNNPTGNKKQTDGGIAENWRHQVQNVRLWARLLFSGIEIKDILMTMARMEDIPQPKQEQFRQAYFKAVGALNKAGVRDYHLQFILEYIRKATREYSIDEQLEFMEDIVSSQPLLDAAGVKKGYRSGPASQMDILYKLVTDDHREEMADVLLDILPVLKGIPDRQDFVSQVVYQLVSFGRPDKIVRSQDIKANQEKLKRVAAFLADKRLRHSLDYETEAGVFTRMLQASFALDAVIKVMDVGEEDKADREDIKHMIGSVVYWTVDEYNPFAKEVIKNLALKPRKENFELVDRIHKEYKPLYDDAARESNREWYLFSLASFLKPRNVATVTADKDPLKGLPGVALPEGSGTDGGRITAKDAVSKNLKQFINNKDWMRVFENSKGSVLVDIGSAAKSEGYLPAIFGIVNNKGMILHVSNSPDLVEMILAAGRKGLYEFNFKGNVIIVDENLGKSASLRVKSVLKATFKLLDEEMAARVKDGGSKEVEAPGGIDFRALPAVVTPMANPAAGAGLISLRDLDKQWSDIQSKIYQGEMPYQEIKKYASVCCGRHDAAKQLEQVSEGITNILKMEEDRAIPTAPELKEILACLG
ncbi:MAG: DHH family phosphoesterase [Candidatus Omnitrophica bacterium]|nr:DHH family phosphoesterase [Candidatus Omnitrophota bacterium]